MLPSAAELVAHFLRTNGYLDTLSSFIKEAGLPQEVGQSQPSQVTIEQILQEKKNFDVSLNFEKLAIDNGHGWLTPAPYTPTVVTSLPTRSNILSVHMLDLAISNVDKSRPYIAVTTADRRLDLVDPISQDIPLVKTLVDFQDSPLLDLLLISSHLLITASMSGKLFLYDTVLQRIIDQRNDHRKYLVKIATWPEADGSVLLASAGWDAKVLLYRLNLQQPQLGEPIADLFLPSIPETISFVRAPDTSSPVLLLTRRDSAFLHYYSVPSPATNTGGLFPLGKQNLAPHSNAWVAFTPSDVQVCPTNPSIIAVATSSTPHMKLLIVRLLIPPLTKFTVEGLPDQVVSSEGVSRHVGSAPVYVNQVAMARAELATQNREEAAIRISVTTMSPQTAYSTPKLAWRPNGTGIYVTSDDGIVRGFEASSGKLITSLHGHEAGSRVRCLSAGFITQQSNAELNDGSIREYLVSGGFDQKMIVWTHSDVKP